MSEQPAYYWTREGKRGEGFRPIAEKERKNMEAMPLYKEPTEINVKEEVKKQIGEWMEHPMFSALLDALAESGEDQSFSFPGKIRAMEDGSCDVDVEFKYSGKIAKVKYRGQIVGTAGQRKLNFY